MNEVKILSNLVKLYHENRLSHAYLIETNNLEKCVNDLKKVIKEINCPNTYKDNCNNCNLCNLLDNNYLPSFIEIKADGKNIKKEQVIDLKNKFSLMPTFTKENIYIIEEAEKLNASSSNTMLKFVEEPTDHIIGFFITNNINNVINTIKSRCEIIRVLYNETVSLNESPYYEFALKYIECLEKETDIMVNKNVLYNKYTEREDINNVLKVMLEIYNRALIDSIDISTLKNLDKENLAKKVKLIIQYLENMNYNVNVELFMDKFVIELSDINGKSI